MAQTCDASVMLHCQDACLYSDGLSHCRPLNNHEGGLVTLRHTTMPEEVCAGAPMLSNSAACGNGALYLQD